MNNTPQAALFQEKDIEAILSNPTTRRGNQSGVPSSLMSTIKALNLELELVDKKY